MFRCTECKAEYEIKPDYCDCGNDTFEEISPQPQIKTTPKVSPKPEPKPVVPEIKKVEPKKISKPEKSSFDPVSTIIFAICIILSFIIVFFVGNPKEEQQVVKKQNTTKISKNIPNINTFWNNTPPKPEIKTVQQPVQVIPQTIPQPVKQVQKTVQQPPKKVVNNIPKVQTVTQKSQPKTVKKSTNVITSQPKTATTTKQVATKQQSQAVQPPKQPSQTITPKQTPVTVKPQQTQTINRQELANYKVALRNVIARKINFINVIGDGSCVVTFSVSSTGNLINRKFQQQSDNFTLNDAVYNAVMQTPSYNPPPAGYKNETMRLTVKMKNGNFEVYLN